MFDESNNLEKIGEREPKNNNEYAERWEKFAAENGEELAENENDAEANEATETGELTEWEKAMQSNDVPEFNEGRPWGFGPEETVEGSEDAEGDSVEQAGKILNYGLDTASRIYSLEGVLKAVQNVDETGRDVENPLGAIYEQLATTPEAKQHLFTEMRKDLAKDADQQNPEKLKVGLGSDGEFHERDLDLPQHESATNAITALKKLIEALETEERFESLRQKAAEQGKSVVEVLVEDEAHPTLAYWLEKVGGFLDDGDVEEVLETIAGELEDDANKGEDRSVEGEDSQAGEYESDM